MELLTAETVDPGTSVFQTAKVASYMLEFISRHEWIRPTNSPYGNPPKECNGGCNGVHPSGDHSHWKGRGGHRETCFWRLEREKWEPLAPVDQSATTEPTEGR